MTPIQGAFEIVMFYWSVKICVICGKKTLQVSSRRLAGQRCPAARLQILSLFLPRFLILSPCRRADGRRPPLQRF